MSSTRRPAGAILLAATALLVPAATAGAHPHAKPLKRWEHRFHVKRAGADPDRDGLKNRFEFRAGTSPRRADSDGDGVADTREDRDRDGVDNATEQRARLDPRRKDSDRDGTADGREDGDRDGLDDAGESRLHWNPRKKDSDGDGIRDGREQAGVITAFDGATLTLSLLTGGTLSGAVTADTVVFCDAGSHSLSSLGDDLDLGDWQDVDEDAGDDDSADDGLEPGDDDEAGDDSADDDTLRSAGRSGEDDDEDAGDDDAVEGDATTCAADLEAGSLVYGASLSDGPEGAIFDELELVG
jgi:heat shock protein beta